MDGYVYQSMNNDFIFPSKFEALTSIMYHDKIYGWLNIRGDSNGINPYKLTQNYFKDKFQEQTKVNVHGLYCSNE
jgi:hypothetical protein